MNETKLLTNLCAGEYVPIIMVYKDYVETLEFVCYVLLFVVAVLVCVLCYLLLKDDKKGGGGEFVKA